MAHPSTIWTTLLPFLPLLTTLVGGQERTRQAWDHLSSTYALIPIHGFHELPRTTLDAFKKNWIQIGDCGDGSPFLGQRYIRDIRDPDIVLIYDVNGYIAGIQNVIPNNLPQNEFLDLNDNPFYQGSRIRNSTNAYFTTAYFIDPRRVCRGGRTQEEYNKEGTGTTLIFQRGRNPEDPNQQMRAPLMETELAGSLDWFEHGCWFNMGKHYAPFNYKINQSCSQLFPGQIIYNNGQLHGFAWMHYGDVRSRRYEHPHRFILKRIFKKGPRCLYQASKDMGISSMHIYFKSHMLVCSQ